MVLRKPAHVKVVLTAQERDRVVSLVMLLIEIDKRENRSNKKARKKASKSKLGSSIYYDLTCQRRRSFYLLVTELAENIISH